MSASRVRSDLVLGSRRELGTVSTVAVMCGSYAAVLVLGSDLLTVDAEHAGAGSATAVLLGVVASVFIAVAVYVGAVVIANGVDTVVSGRVRQIAVLRLLGADTGSLRAAVVRGVASTGAIGAGAGVVAGLLVGVAGRSVLVETGHLRDGAYTWFPPLVVPAAAVITLTAAAAAWTGSRAVLRASPAEALSGATVPQPTPVRVGASRRWASVGLVGSGALVLAAAAALGEGGTAVGFLVAALGAALSGTGLLLGARLVVPVLVASVGRLLGSDPPSVVAARNAVREPDRTTRATMGLVIGVTLVTTFAAGFDALSDSVHSWELNAEQAAQTRRVLGTTSVVMTCVVLVSSAIAAVGFVSTMSLAVVQRTREIGLLRALGFTAGQVRAMITKESVALAVTAVVPGAALGIAYGSLGAQSLVGAQTAGFSWGLPVPVLVAVALTGVLLVLAASWVPSARAVSTPPVEALHHVV